MSSYFRNLNDCGCGSDMDCGCGRDRDSSKCEPLSPCPKRALLECGTTGGTMTFDATGQTFVVAQLSVDTTCFQTPRIDLQFTSQVSAVLDPTAGLNSNVIVTTPEDAEVTLLYELVSQRIGGSAATIGCWTFTRALTGGLILAPTVDIVSVEAQDEATSDTFTFSKCVKVLPGCIDYFVRVTATRISTDSTTNINNASATVSMGQLVAKIQEM